MKCEFCDEEATVHLKQVLKEEVLEMHLCERCAEERGITDPAGFSLQNLLGGEDTKIELPELKDLPSCAHCGFTFQELKKVGRLGCSKCYEAFSSEIIEMLSTMHRGVRHEGKRPKGMFDKIERERAINSIKEKLQQSIEAEDFEGAAKLRDEVAKMESEGKENAK